MAKTYCIVFVITLFVMGDAFRQNRPDYIKGLIYRKAGETRSVVNQQLRLAARNAKMRITTAEQRRCVENLLTNLFHEGNSVIGLTTKKLINEDEQQGNTSLFDQKKAIDLEFRKIVDHWLPENVAKLGKC
ncbi:uncharacterized protein [Rhodnius prolixus]|uniref:Uncharacterized protein n=1 Tax=Rhodnius prolixus TaxID=13249 RepID=T1HZ97_RHOPR